MPGTLKQSGTIWQDARNRRAQGSLQSYPKIDCSILGCVATWHGADCTLSLEQQDHH